MQSPLALYDLRAAWSIKSFAPFFSTCEYLSPWLVVCFSWFFFYADFLTLFATLSEIEFSHRLLANP